MPELPPRDPTESASAQARPSEGEQPSASTRTLEPSHPRAVHTAANAAAQPQLEAVWRTLLAWYASEGRADLPWRATRDPYAVLVSEIMLQQTQVDRVTPKYLAFLERFPTLQALADASTADVIRAWAGLGYNQRAVRLQEIARQTAREFGGALPDALDALLRLKGVGRYTAGAVACFAFGMQVATVDTNIRRVLWRVFRGIEPAVWPSGEAASREALALAEWALPPGAAYDWQQALMDLGATICAARRPACERCPLRDQCAAWAETARTTLFPSGEALARLRDERAAESRVAVSSVAEDGVAYGAETKVNSNGKRRGRTRQGAPLPFTSTTRYFRGRILHALRGLEPQESLSLAALGPLVKPAFDEAEDLPWLRDLVAGLARDGLAHVEGAEHPGKERVSLPHG